MATQPPANPYNPRPTVEDAPPPFAGRGRNFDVLHQALTDPARTHTTLIMGRTGSGKTALLRHFNTFFDDSFIGVYIPLHHISLANESIWLRALTTTVEHALADRDYTLTRLDEIDRSIGNTRLWFENNYLPEIMNIIRRGRRLIFLLDDVEPLLKAVEDDALPSDTLTFLNGLIQAFPALGFVLTLDTRYESQIPALSPLVNLEGVSRLANLNLEDTTWLLTEPAAGSYKLSDQALIAVHRATGGEPRALQRFGYGLFDLWGKSGKAATPDDIKTISAAVYTESETELRAAWMETTRNERLVLTAITSLHYADPLAAITPASIETWLVETDYPLDATAINAAIRGLEYAEIIENTPTGIHIVASLMQTWLLENARLTERPNETSRRPRFQWFVLAVAALVIVVLVLVAGQGGTPTAPPDTPEPTVTLVNP